jgi:hypothetical protein
MARAPAQSQNVVALMSAVTVPPWLTAEARASATRLALQTSICPGQRHDCLAPGHGGFCRHPRRGLPSGGMACLA